MATIEDYELPTYEAFLQAENKDEFIKTLIPGTDSYLYFTLLKALLTGDGKLNDQDKKNLEAYRKMGSTRSMSIRLREALTKLSQPGDSKDKEEALRFLRDEIFSGYYFSHTQPSNISTSTLNKSTTKVPSELDSKIIQLDLSSAYTSRYSLDDLKNSILSRLDTAKLASSPTDVIENFLQRADIFALEKIPQLIKALFDKHRQTSKTYMVPSSYIGRLTLVQLKELEELIPELKRNRDFVRELFMREFKVKPSTGFDFADLTPEERQERRERLLKMYAWTKDLPLIFANFHQHILYELLQSGIESDNYNLDHFLEYLRNPGQDYSYKSQDHHELLRQNYTNWDSWWNNVHCFPTGRYKNANDLVKIYLEHFFKTAKDLKPFDEYLETAYLEKLFYEVKLGLGESVPDINRVFSTSEIKKLNDAKEITILDHNRSYFKHGDEVTLQVRVKNVSSIVVKVFEFNVENYYKKFNKQVDGTINLDGIVASEEKVLEFKEPAVVKSIKELKFENISKKSQGVFIIDLIGGGLSSRTVIRKGRLNFIQRNTLNGHLLTIIDENFEVVKGTRVGVWFDNRFHEANNEGQVLIPYSTSDKSGSLILINGDFAELTQFTAKAESYSFKCAFIYNQETLLMGNKAKVLIHPRLYVNGNTPASLNLLKDVKITVTTTNDLGIPNVTMLENVTLDHRKDIEVEFPVPAKLTTVNIDVNASLDEINKSGKKTVSDSHSIPINTYAGSDTFSNLYLKNTDKGYEVYLLGKNGEPKANIQVNLTFNHCHSRATKQATLATDAEGRVKLGPLLDITSITASISQIGDINGTSRTWALEEKHRINYPSQQIKLIEGDTLNFPVLHNELSVHQITFTETVSGKVINSLLSKLKVENGVLSVPALPVGEYSLTFKDQSRSVSIVVLKGQYWKNNYIRHKNELVEVKNQINNIVIRDTLLIPNDKNPEVCDVKLELYADQKDLTRVHVFAYQFFPDNVNSIAESLQGTGVSTSLQTVANGLKKALYFNNRKLGDEYVYVLDRKNQTRYIGNTLERPAVLLKREFVRDTTNKQEQLSTGEDFVANRAVQEALMREEKECARASYAYEEEERAYPVMAKKAMLRSDRLYAESAVRGGFDSFLNFLKSPSQVYANLQVGEDNSVIIKDFPYKNFASLQIVASNLTATISHTVALPTNIIQTKDQTLKSQLKKDKFYSIARGSTQVAKGKTLEIKDLTSTEIQVVDSLQKLFELEKQLLVGNGADYDHGNDGRSFDHWAFLKNWNTLTHEEKLAKYDKNASHELNVFLYFRDPEFFAKIVRPFIFNKIKKDVVDIFLLGDEKGLLKYVEPGQMDSLSALELILLIVGLRTNHKEHATAIAEQIENSVKLSKVDTHTFKRLFDTVLNSRSEEDNRRFAGSSREIQPEAAMMYSNVMPISQTTMATSSRHMNLMAMNAAPRMMMQQQARSFGVQRMAAPQYEQKMYEEQCMDDDMCLEAEANYDNYNDYDDQMEVRNQLRSGFQELEKTKEFKERTYLSANNRFSPNLFWSELAKYLAKNDSSKPFLTESFIFTARNHPEAIAVLTFLSLPFQPGNHSYQSLGGRGLQIGADSDIIVFHKEIKEGEPQINTNILIAQRFFDPSDRYVQSEEDPSILFEKDPKEFVINKIYGCQVVVTNCSIADQEFQVLCEIPEGSIPVRTIDYTKSHTIRLSSYTTTQIEYFFYFPQVGNFQVYPANVAKDGVVFAIAKDREFKVVAEKTIADLESLTDILSKGSHEDILNFIKTKNIWNPKIFTIDSIYWLLKDKDFYLKVVDTLRARKYFNMTVWSYSLYHGDQRSLKEFLNSPQASQNLGSYFTHINLPIIHIDNSEVLEYHPFINARVHMLAKDKTNILNNEFREQYKKFILYLIELGTPSQSSLLVWVYYLLLQDRIDEAITTFKKIDAKEVATTHHQQLQYDYLSAYLDFYTGFPKFSVAREVVERYLAYPILSWRSLFVEIANQLAEYDGEDIQEEELTKGKEDDAKKKNLKAAEKEESLHAELEGKTVILNYQNLGEFTVSLYEINLEILFSRNPFLSQVILILVLIKLIYINLRAPKISLSLSQTSPNALKSPRVNIWRNSNTRSQHNSRRAICSSKCHLLLRARMSHTSRPR